jgi:K+-transporting ATPase KdpF subunit
MKSANGWFIHGEINFGAKTMNWEYVVSGFIGLGLLVYLTYALLKPERF